VHNITETVGLGNYQEYYFSKAEKADAGKPCGHLMGNEQKIVAENGYTSLRDKERSEAVKILKQMAGNLENKNYSTALLLKFEAARAGNTLSYTEGAKKMGKMSRKWILKNYI